METKPFKPLQPELSSGEKILKEKLDKILDSYYKLDNRDMDAIDNILKKLLPR